MLQQVEYCSNLRCLGAYPTDSDRVKLEGTEHMGLQAFEPINDRVHPQYSTW